MLSSVVCHLIPQRSLMTLYWFGVGTTTIQRSVVYWFCLLLYILSLIIKPLLKNLIQPSGSFPSASVWSDVTVCNMKSVLIGNLGLRTVCSPWARWVSLLSNSMHGSGDRAELYLQTARWFVLMDWPLASCCSSVCTCCHVATLHCEKWNAAWGGKRRTCAEKD